MKYKANTGLLGVNDRKEKETHPDYNGKVYVDKPGLYYLKGWKKTAKSGSPLLSLALDYADEGKQAEARDTYEVQSYGPQSASVAPAMTTSDTVPF